MARFTITYTIDSLFTDHLSLITYQWNKYAKTYDVIENGAYYKQSMTGFWPVDKYTGKYLAIPIAGNSADTTNIDANSKTYPVTSVYSAESTWGYH